MTTALVTDQLAVAGSRLYDAEIALHIARQTQVDEWISAACERLHAAVLEYRALADWEGSGSVVNQSVTRVA